MDLYEPALTWFTRVDAKTGLDQISTAIKQLDAASKTLQISTSDNLFSLQNRLLEAFASQSMRSRKIESDVGKLVKHLVDGKLDAQSSTLNHNLPSQLEELRRLEEAMRELSDTGVDLRENQKILGSLHFSQMQARHYAIQAAHIETYQWIFQDAVHNKGGKAVRFREWLETRSDAFWVHGKPGSGKSTLMKFLVSNESTRTHLLTWAGQKKLVIGKFFFWRAGSPLQKSQQGLLRSLLYEILRQCPELMPVVKEYLQSTPGWESWDDPLYEYLLPVLLEAIARQPIPIRFCLFIDGLDEFQDDMHTHLDLVKTLRKLELSEDIKLCIASRPWTVFADEFGLDAEWNLKLEDLTRRDIHRYVNDKFHEHSQFQRLVAKDPLYSEIIDTVVDRAKGVFLWVFLVVRSLLEGLTFHDSLPTLQRRLQSFPRDLEDYFQYLIDSVPHVYHREMVRYFTLPLKSLVPPAALVYSFLDDIETNPNFLSELPWTRLSREEAEVRLNSLRRRLDGISKGLLEIVQPRGDAQSIVECKVDFIHRTVYDYLDESAELRSLFEKIRQKENIMLAVSHAALAQMKTDKYWDLETSGHLGIQDHVRNLFAYIHEALAEDPKSSATLEDMIASFWRNYPCDDSQLDYHTKRRRFLSLAAHIDFLPYVKSEVAAHPELLLPKAGPEHALGLASLVQVVLLLQRRRPDYPASLRVLKYLLAQGAGLHINYDGSALWEFLCSTAFTHGVIEGGGVGALPSEGDQRAKKKEAIYHIARLLIIHGADIGQDRYGRTAKYYLCNILTEETVDDLIREAKYKRKQAKIRGWRRWLRFWGD